MRRILFALVAMALAGCTVHPAGEQEERNASLDAGRVYEKPAEVLPDHPTREDWARYAMAHSGELQQRYWEWRAAIEQVPIDGTEASNLSLSLSAMLNRGSPALDRTVVGAGNDPMTDLVLPSKLSAAARRSLENARAAGWRFRQAQYELRMKVLGAYDDYALDAEMIRLGGQDVQLLKTMDAITAARAGGTGGDLRDVIKVRNDRALAENDLDTGRSQLPVALAALNALLNRPADAAAASVVVADELPEPATWTACDREIVDRAMKANPELIAMGDEVRANEDNLTLAKLQYVPDFSLSADTDLKGAVQTLAGSLTIPVLRYEAIHAAVEQAEANRRAAEAARRQADFDLAARLVDDLATVHDIDRQLELLKRDVLPRARQGVELMKSAYESDQGSLLNMLDGQRALIDLERMSDRLKIERDKRLLDLDAISAEKLGDAGYLS